MSYISFHKYEKVSIQDGLWRKIILRKTCEWVSVGPGLTEVFVCLLRRLQECATFVSRKHIALDFTQYIVT
jgi:hypothetical protein